MNDSTPLWILGAIAAVALAAWLVVMGWPLLRTLNPDSPPAQLLALVDGLAAAEDLVAHVVLDGGEGTPVEAFVRYVAGPAARIDLVTPEVLQGEVYTLREVTEGWLLVHYRPGEATGVESRMQMPRWLDQLRDLGRIRMGIRLGHIAVASPRAGELVVEGPLGDISRAVLRTTPDDPLKIKRIELYTLVEGVERQMMALDVLEIAYNVGLEYREVLAFPESPRRWIRSPVTAPGA